MKRYDKDFRDEGAKRPFRPRSEGQSYGRSEGRGDSPRFGAPRGREGSSYGGGYGENRGPRPESRDFDRPRRTESYGDRPQRNTFRRDGGSTSGYGRPPSRDGERRFDQGAPQRSERPAERPERAAAAPARALVSATQLKAGIRQANRALAEVIEQFGNTIEGGYDISELEVSVSFGDDGKFLGFGKGGALAMTLSINPLDGEALVDGDEEPQMEMDESMQSAAAVLANFEKSKSKSAASHDDDDDMDEMSDELDDDDSDDDDVEVKLTNEDSDSAGQVAQAKQASHNDDIEA